MRELVMKYKAEKVCQEEMVKMSLLDLKVLETSCHRVCQQHLGLREVNGGARVTFEDEFGAAEEREVLCVAQQGQSGVKRKVFQGLGCVLKRREKVIAYMTRQLEIHVENDMTHVMDLGVVVLPQNAKGIRCTRRRKVNIVVDAWRKKGGAKPRRVQDICRMIQAEISKKMLVVRIVL
uniref:Putative reverse transcriptase domain-containing protein n=1 Tax=Tanacetum cinerariifolium TaxID=118510 RepID=A0A6L2L192_TANCI|nr:putative reverse transcriptase domain-containing protein [Tanacetum cinerariifolium]